MDWLTLSAIAIALAMDAFAVAIVAGITLNPLMKREIFRLSFHFGLFQALMPIIGWSAGRAVYGYIAAIDHWLAFGFLAFVGGKMAWSAFRSEEEKRSWSNPTKGWELVMLSIATSIDALAVGLSLALVNVAIFLPALVIGLVAAFLTVVGMVLGRRIGALWGKRVEVLGGVILIAIGIRIVIEHL